MTVTHGDEVRADGSHRNGVLRITIACTGVAAAHFSLCLHVKSRHLGDAYRYPTEIHCVIKQADLLPLPQIVDVKRPFGASIRGYVLTRNTQCVVIREFDGFMPDGFTVLPASTVSELLVNERWSEMLAKEGHSDLAAVGPPFTPDTLRSVLSYLHVSRTNAKIECEATPNAAEHGFHLGRVAAMHDDHIDFTFFDAAGKWFDGVYGISFASITQIVVGSPYVETFSKYIGPYPHDDG
ncbi:hypothetical protein [Rubripirellula obstinata]|uniref:hypothetical protein n=2 Tax=Rubripirellula obstinata TaxID=406547 RepID=UPI00138FC0A3|nr:hypothetical protein [Rubripirellula obstinata]